jgi:hypothetical protein
VGASVHYLCEVLVNWAHRSALFSVADRSDLVAMMTDPVFLVFNAAYAITFAL